MFFGTTVFVPNSVDKQHAYGFDLQLDMRAQARLVGLGGVLAREGVVQFAPVTGGLFLEDDLLVLAPGTAFTPDHDQRHALFATTSYDNRARGWRVSAAFRYRTGTPVGVDPSQADEIADRPGAEVVDFESGRVKPQVVLDAQAEWTVRRGGRIGATLTFWGRTSPTRRTRSTSAIPSAARTSGHRDEAGSRCA